MAARFDLKEAREMLGRPFATVRESLEDGGEYRGQARYEGLEGVEQVYNKEKFAGRVYGRDGRVEVIYVPGGSALADTTVKELSSGMKGKGKEMRSRAGKEFTHVVYAEEGLAFSAEGDELGFVEVFRPRPLKQYLEDIYRDPGPFTR